MFTYNAPKPDKTQTLLYATYKRIDAGHHVILKRVSGNEKTYIASFLGIQSAAI